MGVQTECLEEAVPDMHFGGLSLVISLGHCDWQFQTVTQRCSPFYQVISAKVAQGGRLLVITSCWTRIMVAYLCVLSPAVEFGRCPCPEYFHVLHHFLAIILVFLFIPISFSIPTKLYVNIIHEVCIWLSTVTWTNVKFRQHLSPRSELAIISH